MFSSSSKSNNRIPNVRSEKQLLRALQTKKLSASPQGTNLPTIGSLNGDLKQPISSSQFSTLLQRDQPRKRMSQDFRKVLVKLDARCTRGSKISDRKHLNQVNSFIPVYNFEDPKKARAAFPLRLKKDMENFLNSCSLRMNCPFQLKFAFLPDGTKLEDLS